MLAYRTDINGLRALAILSVVIFHLKESILPSGFVGVDVFFVISGFLITKIIVKDFRTDSFNFVNFYLRRIRRILPALFVLFICCIIFSALITSPQDMLWFAKTLKYAALQASNFLFQRDVGYFDPPHEGMVLLHTWSLAVEEQFYVIWPIILAMLFKFKRSETTIFYTLISILLISLFFSQYLVIHNQKIAFFSLPSRLWELGMGGMLAFNKIKFSSQRTNEILGMVGLSLIITSFFVISADNFPGFYALLPCFGTALVIISGHSKTVATRLLSNKIFTFFGLISYSLYLWHFPIISFYKEFVGSEQLGLISASTIFLASVIIASLSYQYVETPFRKKNFEEEKIFTFSVFSKSCKIYYPIGISIIAILIFVLISLNIKSSKGWETRVYDADIGYFNDKNLDEVEIFDPSCHVTSKQFNEGKRFPDDSAKCRIGAGKKGSDILLLGDSHLGHYGKGLVHFINKNYSNRSITQLTGGGCSFILDMNFSSNNRSYQKRCDYTIAKMKDVLLESKNSTYVILGARWNLYPEKLVDSEGNMKRNFTKKFESTIEYLNQLDKKIIILGQTPILGNDKKYPLKCFRGKNSPLRRYIHKINNKNIIFFSVNNKFIVEKNILSKIDQKVHVWQINCTIAIKKFSKEIIEFLSDERSLLFLTTSEALSKIYDILDLNKDKINFSKIFLLDHIHYNLCKTINPKYTPCNWGEINALGFMLSFISLLETQKDIYLFGCDGLDNPNQKNVYYGQESILSKRVDRNLSNDVIYNEMMIFNNRWDEIMKNFLTGRDIEIPKIYNVNPDSFYTSFEKMDYNLAFSNLSKTAILEHKSNDTSIQGCPTSKSDLDHSIRLHNLNLSIQNLLPQKGDFHDASLFTLLNLVRKSIKSKIKALFGC